MGKINKIIVLTIGFCIMLILSMSLILHEQKSTYADGMGTYTDYYNNIKQISVNAFKFNTYDTSTSISDIVNNGFAMLENADTLDLSKPKQGVKFEIKANGKDIRIPTLAVTAFLNGKQLSLGDTLQDDGENVELVNNYWLNFEISPNMPMYYFGNQEEVINKQGKYEFYFKLMISQNGEVSKYYPQNYNWYKFTFTVLEQSLYGVDDENDMQFPRIVNADSTTKNSSSNYLKEYNFHYNKKDEYDNAIYPTLRFDPEKYFIKIKRVYNNENFSINTRFVYTDALFNQVNYISDYGILYFVYDNGDQVGFKLVREDGKFLFEEDFKIETANTINYTLPIFYELGNYEITYKYQAFIDNEFVWEESDEGSISIGTDNLIVFGYNLSYAENQTDEKYFISLKGYQTDYSFKYVQRSNNNLSDEIKDFTIPEISSFTSTNQAPVWLNANVNLNSYNTANSYYYYSQTGNDFLNGNEQNLAFSELESTATKEKITKNTYFTNAGYYIVVLDYGYESLVNNTFKQILMFKIANSTPKVKIIEDTINQSELSSGSFTKDSVFIAVEKPGEFDSSILASFCVDANFNGKYTNYEYFSPRYFEKDGEDYLFDMSNEYKIFKTQGKYYVRIYFNKTSYSTYSFTVDKISLQNQVSTYSVKAYNGSNLFAYKQDLKNASIVSEPFTVVIRNKPSGSPITVNLITYDIVWEVNTMQTEPYFDLNNKSYIYTDYVATNASSNQKYENIIAINDNSVIVDSSFIFDEQKIYIFEITDASGYRFVHSVFLDNTKMKFFQYDSNDELVEIEDFNIVSEKATIKWSDNKAILFKDTINANDRNAMALLSESSSNYRTLPLGFSLIIPVKSSTIEALDLTGESLKLDFKDINNKVNEISIYPDLDKYSNITDARFKGEKQYFITINDYAGNINEYLIEMNMDKSLGKMFTTNTPYISGEITYRQNKLNLEQAGSLDALVFEWKDAGEGAFKIASLTYDYYPLIFDENMQNYPYADTPSDINIDLLSNANLNDNIYYSGIINPMLTTYNSYDDQGRVVQNSKIITKLGKYIITRKYVGGNAIEEAGDTSIKYYTYYVDNNTVIDVPDFNNLEKYYIGNGISILFGDNEIPFNEFYRESMDNASITYYDGLKLVQKNLNLILKSNLLPIKIRVPETKYSLINGTIVNSYNIPKTFKLTVTLTKFNINGVLESVKTYNTVSRGFIVIDDITEEGIYKLEINDNALPINNKLSPVNENSNYIAFRVVFEQPTAEIEISKSLYEQSAKAPLELTVKSDIGSYIYDLNRSIVDISSLQIYRRVKIANGMFSDYGEPLDNILFNSLTNLELIAYETKNNVLYTYQYKIVGKLKENGSEFTQFTPIIADFDKFSQLDYNVTSTKDNVAILTFEDPFDNYFAKIDTDDIIIKKYTKLASGSYSSAVTLQLGVDYFIEERLMEDNRIKYSIILYTIDENAPLNEYKFEIAYHYEGQESYYIISGQNGRKVNYYTNSTVLIIDKTAPNYNLNRLANSTTNQTILADNNLSSAYKTTYFKAENGVYYFANVGLIDFAINTDFEFKLPNASSNVYSKSHEGVQIYFRKINKYGKDDSMGSLQDENLALIFQCLVPGDPDYYQSNSARLRFNSAITIDELNYYRNWRAFDYDLGKSFYSMLVESFENFGEEVDGYYEIVEIDEAGNYTVYTVLLNTKPISIYASVNTINGEENIEILQNTNEISSLNSFSITSLNNLDSWYTISVNNKKIVVNPETNEMELINTINNLLLQNYTNELTISNRFGAVFKVLISITTSNKKLGISNISNIVNTNNNYRVNFESDQDGIKLKKITAYVFDVENGVFNLLDIDENGISEDSEGNDIIVDASIVGDGERVFYFSAGIYKFVFEDNFRNGSSAYAVNINIGVYGNYEFSYENEPIIKNGIKYTYGTVTLTAPSQLFEISATKNGNPINININSTNDIHIFRPELSSNDIDTVSGGEASYKVNIYNITTNETETFEFVIYNLFPAVNAYDLQDEDMNSILSLNKNQVSTFTTKAIKLVWDAKNFKFGYIVNLFRYEDGSDVAISKTSITGSSTTVSSQGLYELRFTTNELGSYRSVFFMIKDSTISMYEVYQKLANGDLNVVLPAEELLDITIYENAIKNYLNNEHGQTYPLVNGRLLVKNYFSIYNIYVEVEGDKNLKTNFNDLENTIIYEYTDDYTQLNSKFTTYIIVVYGVSPYSYLDIFAITKIQPNSKFLENFGFIYDVTTESIDENGQTQTTIESKDIKTDAGIYDNIAIYDAPLTVYWQSYYGVSQNQVYMKYYFKNKLIDTVYGSKIDEETSYYVFHTAGEYRLEFYDLAGNKQLFSNSNNTGFTLVLKNQVVYTVNGSQPIYGAVYNSDVVLTVQDISSYVSTGSSTKPVTVEIYRNGNKYDLTGINYTYTFTEQGLYRVLLNASVKDGNATKRLKEAELIFSIIYVNEARFAYEFSNINGYEITKVVKNNIDITETVKGNKSGIYSLLLSAESYGVGHYHIFVKGNQVNNLNAIQEFNYYIWINDEIPVIQSSIKYNETTTNKIELKYNSLAIYEQIGNCKIVIGNEEFAINKDNAEDKISTLNITRAGTYFVTLTTESGNIVSMFKVSKKEPLNAISIILIIIGSIVIIGGGVIFYRLRINMKIK